MANVGERRNALRRYPALGFLGAAALLALLLPSGLTIPSAGPSSLAEQAPVPGDGQGSGDVSDLGAAVSSDIGYGLGRGGVGAPATPDVVGAPDQGRPSLKRCVGKPPRQTEDPLSPPCVAFFRGDNGGATARGVTGDEVRVLFYVRGGLQCGTSRGCEEAPPRETFVDLTEDASADEYVWLRMLRHYQTYFNDRFQTYGRSVRFFVHVSRADSSPAARKADARLGIDTVDPFAVVSMERRNAEAYVEEMARDGVVTLPGSDPFDSAAQKAEFYRLFPGRLWSYMPSLEQRAQMFTSYVCKKVVPHAVSFSGNPGENGRRRRLGLLYADTPTRPDLHHLADLVRSGIERCGGTFAAEGAFLTDTGGRPDDRAVTNMARFKEAGVTTVIWGGGLNTDQTRAAAGLDYRPEWVVVGDNLMDGTQQGQLQDSGVWDHARAMTTYTLRPPPLERVCVRAVLEVDGSEVPSDVDRFGCRWYPDVRQLFIGIQVAGPRLTVTTMDRGFHAIPDVQSEDPTVPACFYRAADYTCVKDAAVVWWDSQGRNPNNTVGCWRMMEGGRRHLPARWPEGDVEAQRSGNDRCNLQNFHPVA